jgi:hypothetical protein
MSIEVFNCEQGSEEWFSVRSGIPTASSFHKVLAKGEGKTRRDYLLRLAGEIITGEPMDSYSNQHMERGHAMEDEARDYYALIKDVDLERIGFIRNDRKGCSPDSLVGADGILEVKTKLPHLAIETILKDKFPAEHVPQCQGNLWVAEREWIDIIVYCPGVPSFIKRAYRDEEYIKKLSIEVDRFNDDLAEIVERIRQMRSAA